MARVFRKLAHVLLILTLVAAVGGHWVVLQSVAWTNMLAGNLRTASVTEAFEKRSMAGIPAAFAKHQRRKTIREENRTADAVDED